MKTRIVFFEILILFLILATSSFAQQAQWTRYATDDGSFSALMPPGALIDAKKGEFGELFAIHAFTDDVQMTLSGRKVRSDGLTLPAKDGIEPKRFKVGDFSVAMLEKTQNGRLTVSISVSDKKKSYNFFIDGPDAQNPVVIRALFGLRLEGKPLLTQEKPETDPTESVAFSKLVTSAEINEARERKLVNTKSEVVFEAKTTDDSPEPRPKYSRPPIIVDRPIAYLDSTTSSYSTRVTGSYKSHEATIRVTLRADGQIGKIVFLGTPKNDFSERVEEAARKIRFVPAQIDGRNVDSEKIVQYSFLSAVFSQ